MYGWLPTNGIVRLVNLEQPCNVPTSICVTVSGIMISVILVLPLNAVFDIAPVPFLNTMRVSVPL